jgi:hypothetical protein
MPAHVLYFFLFFAQNLKPEKSHVSVSNLTNSFFLQPLNSNRKFHVDNFLYKKVFHRRSYATINPVLPKLNAILHYIYIKIHVFIFLLKLDDIKHVHLEAFYFLNFYHFLLFFRKLKKRWGRGCVWRGNQITRDAPIWSCAGGKSRSKFSLAQTSSNITHDALNFRFALVFQHHRRPYIVVR